MIDNYCPNYFKFIEWMKKKGKTLNMTGNESEFVHSVLNNEPILESMKAVGDLTDLFKELKIFIKENL